MSSPPKRKLSDEGVPEKKPRVDEKAEEANDKPDSAVEPLAEKQDETTPGETIEKPEDKTDKSATDTEKTDKSTDTEKTTNNQPSKHTFGGTSFGKPAFKVEEKTTDTNNTTDAKPVFGSTSTFGSSTFGSNTSFGNASVLDKLKDKPSVFGGSSFGSNSKFGNAFQELLKKKSFLDEKVTEKEDASPAPEQYKQVDLQPVKEVVTGEEDEKSLYTAKAKIFELNLTKISDGWKERGIGPLHLNQLLKDPKQVRLVMRLQGLLRVVLNMRITQSTSLIKGLEASLSPGKFLRLNSVSELGEPIQYLLKFGTETVRNELYDSVEDAKKAMA